MQIKRVTHALHPWWLCLKQYHDILGCFNRTRFHSIYETFSSPRIWPNSLLREDMIWNQPKRVQCLLPANTFVFHRKLYITNNTTMNQNLADTAAYGFSHPGRELVKSTGIEIPKLTTRRLTAHVKCIVKLEILYNKNPRHHFVTNLLHKHQKENVYHSTHLLNEKCGDRLKQTSVLNIITYDCCVMKGVWVKLIHFIFSLLHIRMYWLHAPFYIFKSDDSN